MKYIKKINRSVVFTRFFLSYLIILLIPFVAFSILIFSIMGDMKSNSVRESNYVLHSVRDEIDHKMESVYSSILTLNYNVTINDLLNSPQKENDIASLLQAKNEIGYLEQAEDTIYIYLPDDDVLLSSRGVYSELEKLYGKVFSYGNMDYEQFHEHILNGHNRKTFLPEEKVKTNSREYSAILYMEQIPFGMKSGKNAEVLFFIDSDQIQQKIQSFVQDSESSFGIYTNEKELLYSTDQNTEGMDRFAAQYENREENEAGYDFEGSIYTAAGSNFNGWLFVSRIAKKDLYAQIRHIQISIFLLFLIYSVVGCYAAYVIAKRNLQPLRKILALWNRGEHENQGVVDEYQMLESSFQDIIGKNEALTVSNSSYLEKMKEIWIENLICGRYNTQEEIEEIEVPEVTSFQSFLVIIMDFSSPGLLMEEQSVEFYNKKRYCVKQWMKELHLKNTVVTEISIDQLGVLFCSDASKEKFEQYVSEKMKLVLGYLKEKVGDEIRLGRGEMVSGVLRIGDSFVQAKCAVRACHEYGGDYMSYASIPRKDEKYYFPDQLREILFDAVGKGNLKQVKSILKVLNQENYELRQLSNEQSSQFLEEIYSVLLQLRNKEMISEETLKPEEEMDGQDLYYYYVQKILAACMQRTEQAFSAKQKVQQELITFIDENYMDSNLCLGMIASHFRLSESYVSYLFKRTYGVNFSSYLEQKRIEQAKIWLLSDQYSVEEVCRMVGYNSAHVFRRAFRKVLGCNPSDLLKEK